MSSVKFGLSVVFVLIFSNIFAQPRGCVSSTQNLYIDEAETGVFNYYDESDRILNGGNTRCITTLGGVGSCQIRQRTLQCCFYYSYTYTSATLVRYSPLPCPIDNWMWFLILPTGVIAFFLVRKSEFVVYSKYSKVQVA